MNGVTADTGGGFVRVSGTEAEVVRLIAERQRVGLTKYGVSVRNNPLALRQWVRHALEETCDKAIYLQRILEEIDAAIDPVVKAAPPTRVGEWAPYDGEDDNR